MEINFTFLFHKISYVNSNSFDIKNCMGIFFWF